MAYTPGDLLVRAGLISAEAQRRALAMRDAGRGSFGECLVQLKVIDEASLASFYHKRLVVPFQPEQGLQEIAPPVIKMVPSEVAAEFRLIPVALDREGALLVAMADPSDNHAVEEIGFFTDRFIMRLVGTESAIRRAIERHYRVTLPPDVDIDVGAARPVEDHRPSFVPTQLAAPLPAARGAAPTPVKGPLFPANLDEPAYDPNRATLVGKRATEDIVVLTQKKRSDETPLPPPAPPAVDALEAAAEPVLLTRARRERTQTLPGLHPVTQLGPLAALRAATNRDEVAALILDFAAQLLGRAVLFVVRKESLVGFDARGGGLDRGSVEMFQVPVEADSLFRDVTKSRLAYRGPMPDSPRNRTLLRALGADPAAEVLAVPILVRDRVVAILFGDRVATVLPEAALQTVCYEAGLAYERILRQARAR